MVLLCLPQKRGTTEDSYVLLLLEFNSAFPITQTQLCPSLVAEPQFPFTICNSSLWKDLPPAVCCHLPLEARAAHTVRSWVCWVPAEPNQRKPTHEQQTKVRPQKTLLLRNKLKNQKKLCSFLSLKNFLEVNSQWSSGKWILHCTCFQSKAHASTSLLYFCKVHFLNDVYQKY